jgi:hypothetical protein
LADGSIDVRLGLACDPFFRRELLAVFATVGGRNVAQSAVKQATGNTPMWCTILWLLSTKEQADAVA